VIYQARSLYAVVFADPALISDDACNPAARNAKGDLQTSGESRQQYTLAPNPNDGKMVISQRIRNNNPVAASVYNSMGICIAKTTLYFTGKQATLKIGTVAAGVYLLHLQDSSGKSFTLKFEIQP
jgi:hypothetical protein